MKKLLFLLLLMAPAFIHGTPERLVNECIKDGNKASCEMFLYCCKESLVPGVYTCDKTKLAVYQHIKNLEVTQHEIANMREGLKELHEDVREFVEKNK